MLRLPRAIDPSLIEVGDTIRVSIPADKGVEVTYTGTVHHRNDHGSTRYLLTEEGATILAWEVKGNKKVQVLLLKRAEPVQSTLSFFDTDIPERLAI